MLRAVVADDSVIVREGIVRMLARSEVEVVAEAGDGRELVRAVRAHQPDVAIVDIRMPPHHRDEGLRAAHEIRAELPGVGILVVSQHVDEASAQRLLADGTEGVGYLLKDRVADAGEFVDAVRRVAAGGSALDPEVVAHMVGRRQEGAAATLTARESRVLELIAQGLSNRALCARLDLGERAVERQITSIFTKLHLPATGDEHRRVLAVLAYLASDPQRTVG